MGFSKKPAEIHAADPAPASASTLEESPSVSGSSFLSRFSLPLRSRARHIADFHVRPAEPHRRYGAGDQVEGAVVLTVVKPVRITHLVVSLHGFMRVFKSPSAPANEPVLDPADVPAIPIRNARHKSYGNGAVRLFQDEQTLSGDGRLEPGRYEFNFDLLFPAERLPSSIDFERGTISYMITATLTRPATIGNKNAPKTSCERKVYLFEKVDVGPLAPPRPRTIYLEPISKRSKKRKQPAIGAEKGLVTTESALPTSDLDLTRANGNSTEGSVSVVGEDLEHETAGNNARNLVPSDVRSISSDSAVSGSTGLSRTGDGAQTLTVTTPMGGQVIPGVKERTITAIVELQKGGCLQGDVVPVKISVQHIRRIKSLHGVIVTLYRMGRIDSAPPLLFKDLPEEEARRLEKEEYYPKSKTGLGGLSLSSAGSCSVFRKDLSQAFAPLIIDPDTLTASLTTSVRVPVDAFPTIKGVPYEMISFKYHLEVIVDLGGKLATQLQGGNSSGTGAASVAGPLGVAGSAYEVEASAAFTSSGTSIIDTAGLRRQKGVICVVFEVVVGTTDSSRSRGKGSTQPNPPAHTVPDHEAGSADVGRNQKHDWTAPADGDDEGDALNDYVPDYAPSSHTQQYSPESPQPYPYWNPPLTLPPSAPHYIPPPHIPNESALTEKERIRRAEQRLLPSQPPAPPTPIAGPSSPSRLHHGENIYDADSDGADDHPTPVPSHTPQQQPPPSAPTLEDISLGPAGTSPAPYHHPHRHPAAEGDKQELERRRLLAEASAPPEFPADCDHAGAAGGPPPPFHAAGGSGATATPPTAAAPTGFEPSAPVLDEEEEVAAYGPHFAYRSVQAGGASSSSAPAAGQPDHPDGPGAEPLPRYER